ncbi:HAMP domain-containing protein [Dyella dinghuensis]|uniref:histidine kinase n=1 Tax=Dyella dinghuensis TaxID=1920169 RepID=A0A3S0RDG6_9GAMM|nr:ATP-binding protein [Dyella dinghuensis]RUL63195.1 HAMP domain-containing protein [Dyella dinghuensis]
MKRAPSTFSLILGLLVLALLLALTLASILSTRVSLRAGSDTYGHLVVAAALTADELSVHKDAESMQTLDQLSGAGLRFSTTPPPKPTIRLSPLLMDIGYTAGNILGDPSRVVVTQDPNPQIWIRSAHDPQTWIVMRALSYRRQVIASSILVMLLAGLIALAIASYAARLLTRPLERLASHAQALLAGEPVLQTQLTGSPLEVRELAVAIGQAGERLRHASRERELMLAGISHDLRTPLARLRLALELGDANDPQRREAMVADLEELDNALEQCLAFVRDGRDEPRRDIDIVTLIGQLLALRTNPDDWQWRGPPVLTATVRPSLLRRAIGNLMDNAERYGAAPFEVVVSTDHASWSMSVIDHGPGVSAELQQRLGRPFERGDQARGGVGSGLGLSIVARAAELHGGALTWQNGTPDGFVATIRIPVSP